MKEIEKIYQDNFIKVYRYILSISGNQHLAEDVTQDTFFRAMKSLDSFRGDCELTTWLCRIARNLYLNQTSKDKRRQDILKENLHSPETGSEVEQEIITREQTETIAKAVQNLDEPYREVFSLRMFGELAFAEIGKVFGKNDSWARVIFHRAKMKVKEELKDEN